MEIRFEDLDLELVGKVAHNEARMLAKSPWSAFDWESASIALSDCYIDRYLFSDDEIAAAITEQVAMEASENPDAVSGLPDGTPAEFLVGHAIAVAARDHACADIDLTSDEFAERAVEPVRDHALTCRLEGVDAARAVGVDMGRRFESAQSVTPQQVKDIAREMDELDVSCIVEGRSAADYLGPTDYEAIASNLMRSFRDVELGFDDIQDVRFRISDACEGKAARRASPQDVAAAAKRAAAASVGCGGSAEAIRH